LVRRDVVVGWRIEMRIVVILVAALALTCGLVWAQTEQAPDVGAKVLTVVIVVKDPSGTVVAGAHVRIAPVPENLPEKMETDAKGELAVQLKPGGYEVVGEMRGFRELPERIDVKEPGTGQRFTIVLEVAATERPMVVSEETAKPGAGVLQLSVYPFKKVSRVTAQDLKGMARKTLTVHNPHANADETYEGVELGDLLMKYGAPMGKELRGAALGYYVVATGAGGYKAVFSLAEADPSFHPGDVLVVDTMNGKALDARTGPLRLVVTEDKRLARGVRNLVALDVKVAE
jgi:carboxypeptidase family protein/molybdopterin-dependent oxidoreductase-like protein protein